MKQKAQMVIEVYLDSAVSPNTQIDVNHDMLNKIMRSALKVTQGSHVPSDLTVFEEAKISLFKELLPYWGIYLIAIVMIFKMFNSFYLNNKAGFKSSPKYKNEKPTNKQDKQLRERLDEFLNLRNSSPSDFKLPPLSPRLRVSTPTTNRKKSSQAVDSSLNIVFSISNGIKYCLNSETTQPIAMTKADRKQSNSQFSIATHSHKS